MPPKAMSAEMIEEERIKILLCALDLIQNNGFESVTMRTIAKQLNCSATKIYKYFQNKDEVLIAITTESFKLLTQILEEKLKTCKSAEEKLKTLVIGYVDFSVDYRNHYEIIFGDRAPNYKTYIDTELENRANEKHQAGINFLSLVTAVIDDFKEENNIKTDLSTNLIALNLLCFLHGVVSFYHNKILFEIHNDIDNFREYTIDRILKRFSEVLM